MPITLLRPTSKPPVGPLQLKNDHPLAVGLLSMPILDEWGSGVVYDRVSGLVLNPLGSPTWGSSSTQRVGLVTNANSTGVEALLPASLQINLPITIVWKGSYLGTPSAAAGIFGGMHNATDATPFHTYRFQALTGGPPRLGWNISGAAQTLASATVPSVGPYWLAGTIAAGAQALYVNDPYTPNVTSAVAGSTVQYAASRLAFGQYTGAAARNPALLHEVGYVYNRILTAQELAWLKAEPYAMVQPRSARRFISVASGTTLGGGPVLAGLAISGTLTNTAPPAGISGGPTLAGLAISGTLSTTVPGSIGDPALIWTPYNWRNGGTYRETNTQNACVEFEFQSDTLAVEMDATVHAAVSTADWPGLQWSVDHGAWSSIARPNSGTSLGANLYRMTIATGLATGGAWHHVKVLMSFTNNPDRWSTMLARLDKFVKTGGTALDATRPPTFLWTKNFLFFGDSTMEDVDGLSAATEDSWAYAVARTLGANAGQCAFAGTGWRRAASPTNIPQFHNPADTTNQSWQWYSNGQSRLVGGLILPAPDYVLVNLGTNDFNIGTTGATVQAAVTSWLTAIRTACGANARIFVQVPFGQSYQSNLAAAVTASGDSKVYLCDLGTEMALGLGPSFGGATWRATDNIHPTMLAQAEIAARTVGSVKDSLGVGGGPTPRIGSPFLGGYAA